MEASVVRHVIAVRQEHAPDAAQLFHAPDERSDEARRVDENVPVFPADEVALRAVGRFAGVPTAVDRSV